MADTCPALTTGPDRWSSWRKPPVEGATSALRGIDSQLSQAFITNACFGAPVIACLLAAKPMLELSLIHRSFSKIVPNDALLKVSQSRCWVCQTRNEGIDSFPLVVWWYKGQSGLAPMPLPPDQIRSLLQFSLAKVRIDQQCFFCVRWQVQLRTRMSVSANIKLRRRGQAFSPVVQKIRAWSVR